MLLSKGKVRWQRRRQILLLEEALDLQQRPIPSSLDRGGLQGQAAVQQAARSHTDGEAVTEDAPGGSCIQLACRLFLSRPDAPVKAKARRQQKVDSFLPDGVNHQRAALICARVEIIAPNNDFPLAASMQPDFLLRRLWASGPEGLRQADRSDKN